MLKNVQTVSYYIKTYLHTNNVKQVGLLSVPFDKGQPINGLEKGPEAIINGGLFQQINKFCENVDIKNYGNVSYSLTELNDIPNMKQYAHVACCNEAISKSVTKILRDNRICLSLGGDHSIGVGTVDGHLKAKDGNVSVLWIDAHADINTNKTSVTGNIHGMPLGLLVKELSEYWPKLPLMDWLKPVISIRNIGYIGLRSVDPYERLIFEKFGVAAYGMEDVERYGIDSVINMALERIDPKSNRSIHVSYDIDSLDLLEAPSTGFPVRGGLSLREGIHLMETIHDTGRLGAMDLVEVNPTIGTPQDVKTTIDAAIHLILAAFGHSRRGLRPRHTDSLPLP